MFRGPLTDAMLAAMASVGKPVGDAQAPIDGGWQGEPNATGTNFVPYLVLTPGTSNSQTPSGPLADTSSDWMLYYSISAFGVSRPQCEWMADRGRGSLDVLRNAKLNLSTSSSPVTHSIQKVSTITIGSVQRVDATNPPYFGQVDQLVIWVTKGE